MTIPYLKRKSQQRIGDTGRASEKRVAKKIGGKLRPASGAMQGAKGDISLPRFLIEAKSTSNDSIGIKYGYLAKIAHEARSEGVAPALAVTFTDLTGRSIPDGEWMMVPARLWRNITALEAQDEVRPYGEEARAPGPGLHDSSIDDDDPD